MKKHLLLILTAVLLVLFTAVSTSASETIILSDTGSNNFYSDLKSGDTFDIKLDFDVQLDAFDKLTLTLTDESNKTVAVQTGVYYSRIERLCYTMKVTSDIKPDTLYNIIYSYTGSYGIDTDNAYMNLFPASDVCITSYKIINPGTYSLTLANASEGDVFNVGYVAAFDEQWNTVAVDKNKSVTVHFKSEVNDSTELYLCESDVQSTGDFLDYVYINYDELNPGNIEDYGYDTDYLLEPDAKSTYLIVYEKCFDSTNYTKEDCDNMTAYMLDTNTGKTVGTVSQRYFYEDYNEIELELEITEPLNTEHDYIIVFNDGYNLRTTEIINATAEYSLNAGFYTEDNGIKNHISRFDMPAGINEFFVRLYCMNIPDSELKNVEITFMDDLGNSAGTATYIKDDIFKISSSSALESGDYTLELLYKTKSDRLKMYFSDMPYSISANNSYAFNGKTYLTVSLYGESKPSADELEFKISAVNGDEYTASYYKTLTSDDYEEEFVVVADTELSPGNPYEVASCYILEVTHNSKLYEPDYYDQMLFEVNIYDNPLLIYELSEYSDKDVVFYYEGNLNPSATYTFNAYDDVSKTGKRVPVTVDNNKKTITMNKSDASDINTYVFLRRENSYSTRDKNAYLEENGEAIATVSIAMGNTILTDEFAFAKSFVDVPYAVLIMPYNTYTQYKLAKSEDELASAPWQTMTNGVLYKLDGSDDEYTVFAQFKASDNTVSDIQSASVIYDVAAPKISVSKDSLKTYYFSEDESYMEIPVEITSSEEGYLCYELYDDSGYIAYQDNFYISEGTDTYNLYVELYDISKSGYLTFYAEDFNVNVSDEIIPGINFVRLGIVDVTLSDGSILTFDQTTNTVTKVVPASESVVIPSEIDGIEVMEIGSNAFSFSTALKSITIPDSVTTISTYAFSAVPTVTLNVYAGSYAENFASQNHMRANVLDNLVIESIMTGNAGYGIEYSCYSKNTAAGISAAALYDSNGSLKEIITNTPAEFITVDFTEAQYGDIVKIMWLEDFKTLKPHVDTKSAVFNY